MVAFADTAAVPDGVHHVPLAPDDPLASEWSLVGVGPGCAGALVAVERFDALDGSAVAGRAFEARWSFRRGVAAAEGVRLLDALGHALPVDVRDRAAAALDQHREAEESVAERAQAEVMELLLDATGITRPDLAFEAVADDPELLVQLDHACMKRRRPWCAGGPAAPGGRPLRERAAEHAHPRAAARAAGPLPRRRRAARGG